MIGVVKANADDLWWLGDWRTDPSISEAHARTRRLIDVSKSLQTLKAMIGEKGTIEIVDIFAEIDGIFLVKENGRPFASRRAETAESNYDPSANHLTCPPNKPCTCISPFEQPLPNPIDADSATHLASGLRYEPCMRDPQFVQVTAVWLVVKSHVQITVGNCVALGLLPL